MNAEFAILAAVLSLAAAPPPKSKAFAVETRTISATGPQMLNLAEEMTRRGKSADAERLLELLTRDRDSNIRNEARYRRAKLLHGHNDYRSAALLLRRILDERPDATPVRLELAQLLDQMGDKEGAWRQVRAAQATGLSPAVARLIDRYSVALRAQRPFGASFELAIAPDSNINRATRSDTLGTVFGDFQIAADGKAKSGTGLSLHAQTYRRWSLSEETNLLVRVSGFADLYKDKMFNDVAADLAVGPELSLRENRIQIEVGATQRWFGQRPFVRSARVAATASHPLGRRGQLRLSGSAALIDNQINDLQDGKSFFSQVEIERALTPTLGLAASFGLDRQSLKEPGYATTGWRATLAAWRDFGRMTLTAGAQLGRLHADGRLMLFPKERADRYSRFSLGATFRQLQLGGFAPVARLSIERNRSSIEFYDYRRTRTEVGVVRAF